MILPLEDTWLDVLGKAQRGLGFNDIQLADKMGVEYSALLHLKEGNFNPSLIKPLCQLLNLKEKALIELAHSEWFPDETHLAGLVQFNTPFDEMTVNSFLAYDTKSKKAVLFDTGADATPALNYLKKNQLVLECILLTHTHGDHILELDHLVEKTKAPAFVNELEPLTGATSFSTGKVFQVGSLTIQTRRTWGHSLGGTTYIITGLNRLVAIVGDALFASSMGGAKISYPDALETNRNEIFSLPDDTILCPGHGPTTSVGEEKEHNPFYT